MFGSVNINSDYTFTQPESRVYTGNISQALSSYLGKKAMSKSEQDRVSEDETKTENTKTDTKKNAKSEKNKKTDIQDLLNKDLEDTNRVSISYGNTSTITTSFDSLAAAVGASSDKVSKTQLIALLQSLVSEDPSAEEKAKEIAFVKNLIAKFDTLAEGSDYITSFSRVNEPQDYETVTTEQVTPPIDLRV